MYENNSFNLNFTFGYDGATLSQALKRLTGNANTASMVEASDTSEKDAYAIIDKIYPVGSIYMSVNNTNPSLLFAGTAWEPWGAGRVPVGVDANDTDFASAGLEGGEKTHTLTVEGYCQELCAKSTASLMKLVQRRPNRPRACSA